MRKLNFHDVFMFSRVLKKVGIKDELVELVTVLNDKANNVSQTTLGAKLILSVYANCGDEAAEKAFFEFLSGPTEISTPDLANMDITSARNLIAELVMSIDIEEWKAFFISAAQNLRK